MSRTYRINKGVGKPVEFKGLVGHYIWWLGGAILIQLFVFAILYLVGVPLMACMLLFILPAAAAFIFITRISKQFGEHGWMKHNARKYIPKHIKGCVIE